MSLQTKDLSSKQGDQAKLLSTFIETYDDSLGNMSNNNKISNKFDIARTENERYFKLNLMNIELNI